MIELVEILKNGIDIITGYLKWFYDKISGKTNKMSNERMAICRECPFYNNGICDLCGCVLEAKTRVHFELDEDGYSIDGCPERKW